MRRNFVVYFSYSYEYAQHSLLKLHRKGDQVLRYLQALYALGRKMVKFEISPC